MIDQQTFDLTAANLPQYADEESHLLIQHCLASDEAAYVALYELYSGMIYRLNFSLLQHTEDAEEVLQDSFEYAFRRLHKYDANKSAFKTGLYRIAVSRCRNKRRRKWLPTFSINQLVGFDAQDEDTPSPDAAVLLTEKQKQVWEALQTLSPKLRETAVLRYYENLSYKEIDAILDIPSKTVESRIRLAHKALKKLLNASDFE